MTGLQKAFRTRKWVLLIGTRHHSRCRNLWRPFSGAQLLISTVFNTARGFTIPIPPMKPRFGRLSRTNSRSMTNPSPRRSCRWPVFIRRRTVIRTIWRKIQTAIAMWICPGCQAERANSPLKSRIVYQVRAGWSWKKPMGREIRAIRA